jgi:SAM-dependent methyltransferase
MAELLAREADVSVQFHAAPQEDWHGRFAVIFAFEVLEHIEDDAAALAMWVEWLRPGGVLVLSVPAHMKLWTAGDEWAGHYRRYERVVLERLMKGVGLKVDRFECYGYPMANLGERLSAASYRRRIHRTRSTGGYDRQGGTDRSGIERGVHIKLYPLMKSPVGRVAVACGLAAQRLFVRTDLGSGYVLLARRT